MGVGVSILDEQGRQKLDGIVQQMIANKESEEDIRSVVDDFKGKYSAKKKEPSYPLLYKGQKGQLLSSLKPSVPTPSQSAFPKETEQKVPEKDVDPVGDYLAPKEQDLDKSYNDFLQLGNTQNRLPSESTQPNIVYNPTLKQQEDKNRFNVQQKFEQSRKDYDEAIQRTYNNFFASGKEAQDYAKKMIEKHGLENVQNNKTVQLAASRANQYNQLKQRIEQQPDLGQLSVDLARENNSHLDEQISALEKGHGIDKGGDYYTNYVPQVLQGHYLDNLINDPDVIAAGKENPQIQKQLDQYKDGKIYEALPEYGEYVVKNIMSREYEKRRANPVVNVINDKSKYLDNLADELFADNPTLKKIADKMKGNWQGKIDTGGAVESFKTGLFESFKGMGESLKDVIGAGKSTDERIFEHLKEQYGNVNAGVTGWRKDFNNAVGFLGTIAGMATPGGYLKAAGLSPAATRAIVTSSTFFDNELNTATAKYPNDPWKANVEAIAMTALYNAAGNALPAQKVGDVLAKAKPEISKVLENLSESATKKELQSGLKDVIANTFKGIASGSAEMTGITAVNQMLDKAFGMSDRTFKEYHPDDQLIDVAKSMALGLAFPKAIEAMGSTGNVSNSLYDIANNPKRFSDLLMQSEITPDAAKKLEDISYLTELKQGLDQKGIDVPNQKRFLLEKMNEKYDKEKLAQVSPESIQAMQIKENINRYSDVQGRILSGEDVAGSEIKKSTPNTIEPDEISKPIELSTELPEGYKTPEQKQEVPEVNLPGQKPKEPEQTKAAEEELPFSEQPQPPKETETPPGAPGEPVKVSIPSGDNIGITHAQMNEVAKELGLPEYEGSPETKAEWDIQVQERLDKDPKAISKMLQRLSDGKIDDPVDQRMMLRYMASLKSRINENPTPELLAEWKRGRNISDISGRMWGKVGVARQGEHPVSDTLADYLIDRGDDKGRPLSEEQIKTETKKYNELKAVKEKLETQLEQEREQYTRMAAEYGIGKAKEAAKKASKKSSEDYSKERSQIVNDIVTALRKDEGVSFLGVGELVKIAPHVKKYAQSLIEQGIGKLDDIVTHIYNELKDKIDVSRGQIIEILGGKHDEVQPTKAEKSNELRLIQREAKLLKDLQDAKKGLEKEKSERGKDAKTRRIEELENKIKEVRQLNKQKGIEERPAKEYKTEEERNAALQKSLLKRAEKLQSDLSNKRYAEEKRPDVQFVKSKKTIDLEDKVISLQKQIQHERIKDIMEKRSTSQKVYDFATREVLGVKRLLQTILDWSIWLRQTARLAFNPRKWDVVGKEISKSWQATWSQKKFDRYMNEIHKDPQFDQMTKDGIVFNEFETNEVAKENEFYFKNWIFKVPYLRQIPLSSQRAADSALNVARYELYRKYRKNLEDNGITRESDPEVYQWMANEVMNQTGRGKLLKMFENNTNAQKVLGNTFYGARLMASNFNQLNPVYYARMPKEVRGLIWKDIASYVVTTMATGAAMAAAGGKVSFDPDDSDFLQVRFGGKVYDITGGKVQYIRTALRMLETAMATGGEIMGSTTKNEAAKKQQYGAESLLRFFRNKLAPNTGYVLNLGFPQKETGGREVGLKELLEFYPMYADDVKKAFQDEGLTSIATTLLPNLIGIGYNQYFTDPAQQPLEDLLNRNVRSDAMDLSKYKNYKEGGREINKQERDDFIKKRDTEIESNLKKLHEGETPVIEKDSVIKKKYNQLTREQIISETSRIKSEATQKIKEEMFGKEKKTRKERILERKLKKERQNQ